MTQANRGILKFAKETKAPKNKPDALLRLLKATRASAKRLGLLPLSNREDICITLSADKADDLATLSGTVCLGDEKAIKEIK